VVAKRTGSCETRPDESRRISTEGSRERDRSSRLEGRTDVLTKPLYVELSKIDSVEQDPTSNGIVEPLGERDDSRLSASGASDESGSLASRERDGETVALEDGHSRPRRVVEEDVLKLKVTDALGRLETLLGERVDGGN
jgi:hypothetical protein